MRALSSLSFALVASLSSPLALAQQASDAEQPVTEPSSPEVDSGAGESAAPSSTEGTSPEDVASPADAAPSEAAAPEDGAPAASSEDSDVEGVAEGATPAEDGEDGEPTDATGTTSTAPAPAGKLLVLDLVDRGAGAALTKLISEAAGAQAGRSSTDDVVTAAALRATLDAAELAVLSGCDAEECMASLASEVEADRVLGGSAALAGDDVIVTMVLVDASTGARLGEAQRKVRAQPALVAYTARSLVAKALGGPTVGEAVPVLLESDPPGASAFVDGGAVGSTPVVATVMPGSHEVTFRADGFEEQRLGLVVEDGTPIVVSADLARPTIRLWPIAAALGGVALLSSGGATWAGISAANAYDGSFGFITPDEDVARSYRYASPTDSAGLAAKQQQVEQLSLLANVLWTITVVGAVSAVLVESADVALWALGE